MARSVSPVALEKADMRIQPIVEGYGDVAAFPVLLRRLVEEAQAWAIDIGRPIRRPRHRLVDEVRGDEPREVVDEIEADRLDAARRAGHGLLGREPRRPVRTVSLRLARSGSSASGGM